MSFLRATLRSIAFGVTATVAAAWLLAFASTGQTIGPAALPNRLAPGSPPRSGLSVLSSTCRYEWAPESNFDPSTHLGQLQATWRKNVEAILQSPPGLDPYIPIDFALGTHRWPAWAQLPDCTHAQTGLAPNQGVSIDARGFPFPALSCSTIISWYGVALPHPVRAGIAIKSPRGVMNDSWKALPLKPIPAGFLFDVVFLSGVWGSGEVATRRIRQRIRERRYTNRFCPHCAYSLQNLPLNAPCPECGQDPTPRP